MVELHDDEAQLRQCILIRAQRPAERAAAEVPTADTADERARVDVLDDGILMGFFRLPFGIESIEVGVAIALGEPDDVLSIIDHVPVRLAGHNVSHVESASPVVVNVRRGCGSTLTRTLLFDATSTMWMSNLGMIESPGSG